MTDQSTDATKVQLDKPVSFIGVTYRNMGEGFLTGAEMTQTPCITKAHPSMNDISQSLEPELTAQPAGSTAGWSESFPGAPDCLNLF